MIFPYDYWYWWALPYAPAPGWQLPGFVDNTWQQGYSGFGYGYTNETTTLGVSNQVQTAYFRQHFSVTNAASVTNLTVLLRRADGVVLYLNGIEVLRDNMPSGAINFNTLALAPAPDAGTRVMARQIPLSALHEGQNLLAAEVHHSAGKTNLTFDLSLMANATAPFYTQMFPPGMTAFAPQLMPGSNGVPISQLLPNVPPGTHVSAWTPSGMLNEYFDPNLRRWQPGTTVFMPGYGAILFNPTPNTFQVNITGWSPYPPQNLQLQRNVPALVARQTPSEAKFADILGYAPQNGTTLSR
ncbi:MAG: hypothetical protein C5B50_06910, partial [Verrucomicrobia bacterium]